MSKEVVPQLDIVQDNSLLLNNEIWLRNSLKKLNLALSSTLRTVARLRSRIGWLQEGDANTRLFHMHARHRKRKNFIAKLWSDELRPSARGPPLSDVVYTSHGCA
jgi:hypothetical protein